MSNYTAVQEMFLMNVSVNEGSEQTGSGIEQKMYDKSRGFLDKYSLTNWDIIWGPAVYRIDDNGVPDQVMFLAKDAATSRYFISISGTNPYSILNWYEDFEVTRTTNWPWNNAGTEVQLAFGSMLALRLLLSMEATARVNGAPVGNSVSINDFLKAELSQKTPGSCSIITGGHSLGGAISPIFALWMRDNQYQWDPNKVMKQLSSWPSAGPTPGTQGFKEYYEARVPDTHRIHNSKDVVPHAWNGADLEAIKSLYQPEIAKSDCVDYLVDLNIAKVQEFDYIQAGSIDVTLTGSVNTSIIKSSDPPGYNFAVQVGYQHVDAYFQLLGINRVDLVEFDTVPWLKIAKKMAQEHAQR